MSQGTLTADAPAGQAAPDGARRRARVGAARALRALARLAAALVVVVTSAALIGAVLIAALMVRLGQSPLDISWARPLIERRATATGYPLRLGRISLAWDGWRDGLAAPLRIEVDDARLAGGATLASVAVARATVAPSALLAGQPWPTTVSLDDVHLRVDRTADGRIAVAGGGPAGKSGGGGAPNLPEALRAVHVHGLTVDVADAGTGIAGQLTGNVDLDRGAGDLLHGHVHADLTAGDRRTTLDATAEEAADESRTSFRASLSPTDPAALADLLPSLAPLSMFDAPVGIIVTGTLGPHLTFQHVHFDATAGAGVLRLGEGTAPIVSITLGLDATPDTLETTALSLVTAPRPDGPRTTFSGHIRATRATDGYAAHVTIAATRVAFADLPALWPEGTGGPGTRPWITENITGGTADNTRVDVDLTAPTDLSDVALDTIDGSLDGHDLTVWWLRPMPPLVGGEVHMTITRPDEIDLAIARAGMATTAIRLDGGTIKLTGIAGNDQFAAIRTPIAGPLRDVVRILSNPRLALLSKSPVPLADTAGTLAGTVVVAHLPLRDEVSMDELGVATDVRLRDARIGKLVAGRDLDHGQLRLRATADGLTVAGTAAFDHVPTTLSVGMDFRPGPPSEVTETAHVVATVGPSQLARFGITVTKVLTGRMTVAADARVRRDGLARVTADADLTGSGFAMPQLPWRKPVGRPLAATAAVTFDGHGLRSIDDVRIRGPGVDIAAAAAVSGGRPSLLRIARLRVRDVVDLAGTIGLPASPERGWTVDLAGPLLDLTGVREALRGTDKAGSSGPATPITATARVDRVVLDDGHALIAVAAHVERDRDGLRVVDLSGLTAGPPASPFRVLLRPTPLGRRIEARTDDLGAVLAGFGVTDAIGGGRLDVLGKPRLDGAGRPSTVGTARLDGFRVRDAPFVARLLKALTLYGIVDLLRGPGVGVTRLTLPFTLTGDVLTLRGARAVSPSLGVTMKGQVDLGRQVAALNGTVVPAWILNSLPGRLPLVGRLFSPERGGGVVALLFSLNGKLADPRIGVNPLSLLTPGALRTVFDDDAMPMLPVPR